jgi:predicted nucleotidyltransferase
VSGYETSHMETPFEAARAATLAALVEFAEQTPGVEGLWLQGSLARGDADAFSDIDAYLAISDADFDEVWAGRGALLERLGGALAWSDATAPGLTAVHALMAGGAKLDLFFEKASAAPGVARPVVRPLVDRTGLVQRLKLGWQAPTPAIGRIIQTIIRMTRQGATWPLRVMGRDLWPTLAMMELDLINAQLAQLMAVRHDPANFYRNPYSLAQLLTEDERSTLAALTAEALAALAARDPAALKATHLRVFDVLAEQGRAACAALGVDYPVSDAGEREVRALIERNWPEA